MKKWNLLVTTLLILAAVVCAQTWEPVQMTGTIPSDRYGHTMIKIGTAYYLFGGTTANRGVSNELFKLEGNNFSKVTTTGTVPGMSGHNVVRTNDSKMIVLGGSRDSSSNAVYTIDPAASNPTWESKGAQPFADRKDSASIIVGDELVVSGGRTTDNSAVFADTWICNLTTNTWKKSYDMPWGGRYGHTLAQKNGLVYVIGGKNPDGDDVFAIFSFHPKYGSWDIATTQGEAPLPRTFPINGQEGNELIIAGGVSNASTTTLNVRTTAANPNVDLGDVWKLDMTPDIPTWVAVPLEGENRPVFSQSAGFVKITTDPTGKPNVQVMTFGGLKGTEVLPLGKVWQYNSTTPPQPTVKEVNAKLAALGRIRYAIHFIAFEQEQAKVSLAITWNGDAKLRLCALYIPWVIRDQHAMARLEDNPEEFEENVHLGKLLSSKVTAEGNRGKLEKVFTNLKRGTLVLLVQNASLQTAQNVNLKLADFTNNPSRYTMLFPIGKPELFSNANARDLLNTVQFPVAPVRWESRYVPSSAKENIIETTLQSQNSWIWNCLDKNKKLLLIPGYVKFYLP